MARGEAREEPSRVAGARGKGSLPECQGRYRDDRQGPERRRGGCSARTLGTRDLMSANDHNLTFLVPLSSEGGKYNPESLFRNNDIFFKYPPT